MKTPILDFVTQYREAKASRFHMPGHKGKTFLGMEDMDITEIDGADVLYSANGIINESEDNLSSLFGTAHSFYSAEGSTLVIKAMLTLVAQGTNGEHPLILAGRNAHKAFIYGAALLDMDVEWLYPEPFTHLCQCTVTAEILEKRLAKIDKKPCAVYITSPDYLGQCADIRSLADICRKHDIPLLVDNAHGAYLHFLEESRHPIALGASMCCDSAHKTLPVLTGGGYLHIGNNAPAIFSEKASYALSLFASTSPSYLIMRSLDKVNGLLAATYGEELASFTARVQKLKDSLIDKGYSFVGDEALKLTFDCKKYGYKGTEFAEYLLPRIRRS